MAVAPRFSPETVLDASRGSTSAPAVELRGVHKHFSLNGEHVLALDDVSLSIGEGEFVALVGPSGCGKSTLLRLVAGLVPPSQGDVRVFGGTSAEAVKKRSVGFVFQNPVLLPWRAVTANVQLPLELVGPVDAAGRRRVQELIELVGLQGFEQARPSQLSGGMRQRAALARALITQPRLLLLDEPFGALDEMTRQRMNLELLRIWREVGVTTLLVTHSIAEAVFLAHRIVVLSPRPGRVTDIVPVEFEPDLLREAALLRRPEFFSMCSTVSEALYAAQPQTGP